MTQVEDAVLEASSALQTDLSLVNTSTEGRSHTVHQLAAREGHKYVLRIPNHEFAALMDKQGHKILKFLSKLRPSLPIPKVVLETSSFTLHEYVEGVPIRSWNLEKIPEAKRHKILDGIAEFLVSLWVCPAGENAASASYRTLLYDEVDKAFFRSLKQDSGWGDPVTFLIRRTWVEKLVPVTGSKRLAVRHGDLNAWNVLADEEGLSGVIDWDTAKFVPSPAAIQHPLFIADIPGWVNDVPEGMSFHEDRLYLERAVQDQAGKLDCPEAHDIPALLSSSFERQFFELALRNKAINRQYIARHLGNVEVEPTVLCKQLEEVLLANPEWKKENGVLEMCGRLGLHM